ncbi:N-acetylmuramoyl-L-alanine amidase [Candidatus Babeliales bacterium]|nr:N-acetylmuramoyl-L-alanine amidase [Candidatus Babeliales bacterium]
MSLKNFLAICCTVLSIFHLNARSIKPFSIMLDPAGDAQNTGRIVGDSFERGITLQFAEALKHELEATYQSIRVILSRVPGETIEPLQNANFANRLNVDLYLSIHFYEDVKEHPQMYLYYFIYNPVTDRWNTTRRLSFYPYDQAHLISIKTTQSWAQTLFNNLNQQKYKKLFTMHEIAGLPFKPLIGVRAPALALEASLKSKRDWSIYLEPIVASLGPLLQKGSA